MTDAAPKFKAKYIRPTIANGKPRGHIVEVSYADRRARLVVDLKHRPTRDAAFERAFEDLQVISGQARIRNALELVVQGAIDTAKARGLDRATPAYVLTEPGWSGDAFSSPLRVYAPDRGKEHINFDMLNRPERWEPRGELDDWLAAAREYGRGNRLVRFLLCLAFTPALLQIVEAEGFAFYLVGGSSTGKSIVLRFVASAAFGSPHAGRVTETWKMTTTAFENHVKNYRHQLLVLDDTNAMSGTEAERAVNLRSWIAGLTDGGGAERPNQASALEANMCFVGGGNRRLADLLAATKDGYAEPDRVRLVELPCGEFGVFDRQPKDGDLAAFAEGMRAASKTTYGVAFDSYIRRLVQKNSESPRRLRERIQRYRDEARGFLGTKTLLGVDRRISEHFVLVYAAGRLAAHYGVLPWDQGELERAAIGAYRRYREGSGPTSQTRKFLDALGSYVRSEGADLPRVAGVRNQNFSGVDKETSAFWIEQEDGERHLAISPRQFDKLAGDNGARDRISAELANLGALVVNGEGEGRRTDRLGRKKRRFRVYRLVWPCKLEF